jgi:hypothetical protein
VSLAPAREPVDDVGLHPRDEGEGGAHAKRGGEAGHIDVGERLGAELGDILLVAKVWPVPAGQAIRDQAHGQGGPPEGRLVSQG